MLTSKQLSCTINHRKQGEITMKTFSYRIEPKIAEAFDQYCKENHLIKSGFVGMIIEDYLAAENHVSVLKQG